MDVSGVAWKGSQMMQTNSDTDGMPSDHTAVEEPSKPTQTPSFEAAFAQLSDLVNRLESGALGLSDSITAYEQGVAILRQLNDELTTAEHRISVLVRADAAGRPIIDPVATAAAMDLAALKGSTQAGTAPPHSPADSSLKRDAAAGGARRSSGTTGRSKRLPGMDDPSGNA